MKTFVEVLQVYTNISQLKIKSDFGTESALLKKKIVHWYLIKSVMFSHLFFVFYVLRCFFSYPYVIPVDILQGLDNMKNLHGLRGNRTVL